MGHMGQNIFITDGEGAEGETAVEGAEGADAAVEGTEGAAAEENTEGGSQKEVDTTSLMDGDETEGEGAVDGNVEGEEAEGKEEGEEGKDEGEETGAPDEYADFDVPEGAALDIELLAEFSEEFKADNLTQKQAQARVDQGLKLATKWQEKSLSNMQTTIDDWRAKTRTDSEIGGDNLKASLAAAKQARDTFGDQGFNEVLEQFGLGNHPSVIRFLTKVRGAVSDDVFVKDGKPTKQPRSAAQNLFGNTHTRQK